jgi:hypothetical protein
VVHIVGNPAAGVPLLPPHRKLAQAFFHNVLAPVPAFRVAEHRTKHSSFTLPTRAQQSNKPIQGVRRLAALGGASARTRKGMLWPWSQVQQAGLAARAPPVRNAPLDNSGTGDAAHYRCLLVW